MINSTETSEAELLLCNSDFPENYINMQHPDDYKTIFKPFVEYIPHFQGHHNRLIARICWKVLSANEYIPMSFVCDTGAPMGFYLSEKALLLLKKIGIIQEDETGIEYVNLKNIGKIAVTQTPPGHAPANIIGLRLLTKLELGLTSNGTFVLNKMPLAFENAI